MDIVCQYPKLEGDVELHSPFLPWREGKGYHFVVHLRYQHVLDTTQHLAAFLGHEGGPVWLAASILEQQQQLCSSEQPLSKSKSGKKMIKKKSIFQGIGVLGLF